MNALKRRASLGTQQDGDNKRFCPAPTDNQGYSDEIYHDSVQDSLNQDFYPRDETSNYRSDDFILDLTQQASWNQPMLVTGNDIAELSNFDPGPFEQAFLSPLDMPEQYLSSMSAVTAIPSFNSEVHKNSDSAITTSCYAPELDTFQSFLEHTDLDCENATDAQVLMPIDDSIPRDKEEEEKEEVEEGAGSPRFDTCFGEIVMEATSSFDGAGDKRSAQVTVEPFGNLLKLLFTESKKYAGIVAMPALRKLLEKHSVHLMATLFAPVISKGKDKKKAEPDVDPTIHVVVYGNLNEKDSIGACLADGNAFLQHPRTAPYYPGIAYVNPHYLVRPGGEMPRLEELIATDEEEESNHSGPMSSREKDRIMQIFDSAMPATGKCYAAKQSPRLMTPLEEHQLVALSVMMERESGSLDDLKFPSLWERVKGTTIPRYCNIITGETQTEPTSLNGGILADEMGLGKTLSLLALICLSLDDLNEKEIPDDHPRATLIVVPKSSELKLASRANNLLTVQAIFQWEKQIEAHIRPGQVRYLVYHGSKRQRVQQAFGRHYDIVFTTYETLRSDSDAGNKLQNEKWYRVVLDEGGVNFAVMQALHTLQLLMVVDAAHKIRNPSSGQYKAAATIKAYYRWCLTGTPIQNSLDDYRVLLAFLQVWIFQDKRLFDFWITGPMSKKDTEGVRRLKSLVAATCLRRTKAIIGTTLDLPAKTEVVESLQLTDTDRDMYEFFKRKASKVTNLSGQTDETLPEKAVEKKGSTLSTINILRLICNHGEDLLPASAVSMWREHGNTKQVTGSASPREENSSSWPRSENQSDLDTSSHTLTSVVPSTKVLALLKNLEKEQRTSGKVFPKPGKSVVFSQWAKMLDLIAEALHRCNYKFARLDGQSSLACRSSAIRAFSEEDNCTVMLASTGSAAEGINLTAARFVHILDPHWNPMIEAQAVGRVHRIGQSLDVVVTRYLISNSIEDYVQFIQEDKKRVTNTSLAGDSLADSMLNLNGGRHEMLQRILTAAS